MMRCSFVCLSLFLFCQNGICAEKSRPNLIIFFTDDQGYNDVGCFGSPLIATPNFDRMAAEGLRLTSFYTQPVCGVSRAALMSGCYPIRVGEPRNTKSLHTILHPEEITIAEVLGDAGYATGMVGKWHLAGSGRGDSWNRDLLPNAQGFDYWFGAPTHNGTTRTVAGGRHRTELMRNGEIVDAAVDDDEMAQITKQYTVEAVKFIRDHRDENFFLYLAHTMPHVPINASEEFLGKSKRGLYGDVIEELDWSLGQVLAELKELGLDENTLVVFTSDNGPWIEKHLVGKGGTDSHGGSADPLRGAKMMTWEGGLRVPAMMRWPGKIEAGRESDQIVSSLDLYPTFAKLAGAELPPDRKLDGIDQSEFLIGESDDSARDHFFYYAGTHLHAVRWNQWKLVRGREARPKHLGWWGRMVDGVPETALFDLGNDIGEARNVAAKHPEIVARLETMIESARADLGDYDQIGKGARFFDPDPRRTTKDSQKPAAAKGKARVGYDEFEPLGNLRFDFESGELDGWEIVEGAFEKPVSDAASLPRWKERPFNRQGKFHLSTAARKEGASDKQTGVLESPKFRITGDKMAFLLGGGSGESTCLALCDESGKELVKAGGPNGPQMKRIVLEVSEHRGKTVSLKLVDRAESNWGHLCFDDFSAAGEWIGK